MAMESEYETLVVVMESGREPFSVVERDYRETEQNKGEVLPVLILSGLFFVLEISSSYIHVIARQTIKR